MRIPNIHNKYSTKKKKKTRKLYRIQHANTTEQSTKLVKYKKNVKIIFIY